MSLADIQQLTLDLARDQGDVVSSDARNRAIEAARLQYSADCPRPLVRDIAWPEGDWAPVPAGWTHGAWVVSAEYPLGRSPRELVEVAAYQTPDGWQLMAASPVPEGALVRLSFMAGHELSATADTLPAHHRLSVAQYAAGLVCHQLATHYSAQRETAMGSDASLTETRAREFAARSKELRAAYYAGVGIADPFKATVGNNSSGATAAAGVVSWPSRNPRHRLVQRGGL